MKVFLKVLSRVKIFFTFLALILLFGIATAGWIVTHRPPLEPKIAAVRLISLPDLAVSTEAHFIRHRSVSDLADIFGLGPALLPYFPSDFVYAPAPYTRALQEIR